MNKKLLVSVFLCFFVFSSVVLAEEKAKTIEHLIWLGTGIAFDFKVEPTFPYTDITRFEYDPIFTFQMPASPKSSALFFEYWAELSITWSENDTRRAEFVIWFEITSDVVPNIKVIHGIAVMHIDETNHANDYDMSYRRENRQNYKVIMRRDRTDYWRVYENDQLVSDEVAISTLNDLIDTGFDVKVYGKGKVKGVKVFWLRWIKMEATRLSK